MDFCQPRLGISGQGPLRAHDALNGIEHPRPLLYPGNEAGQSANRAILVDLKDAGLITDVIFHFRDRLAVLNWTARDQMSSRSERRPTMVANFVVFLCGAMVLVKAITSDPDVVIFWILAVVYAGFAAAFGEISFRAVKVR